MPCASADLLRRRATSLAAVTSSRFRCRTDRPFVAMSDLRKCPMPWKTTREPCAVLRPHWHGRINAPSSFVAHDAATALHIWRAVVPVDAFRVEHLVHLGLAL